MWGAGAKPKFGLNRTNGFLNMYQISAFFGMDKRRSYAVTHFALTAFGGIYPRNTVYQVFFLGE